MWWFSGTLSNVLSTGSLVCLGSTFVDIQKAPHLCSWNGKIWFKYDVHDRAHVISKRLSFHLASQCQEETNSHLWKTQDLQHELVDKIFSGKVKSSLHTNDNFKFYPLDLFHILFFMQFQDMSLFQSLVVDTLSGSSNEQGASTYNSLFWTFYWQLNWK